MTPEDVANVAFRKPPFGKRGYNSEEVDEFLELIAERLRTGYGLTADDIVNVAFAKPPFGQRGYDDEEVDEFLDHATEALRQTDRRG